jgi:hypothetical protein
MSDILREIDDELQREHMAALWHKYKIVVVGAIVVLLIGTASYSAWRDHDSQANIKRSVALGNITANVTTNEVQKSEALAALATEYPATGHAVLARFAAATALNKAGQTTAAVQALQTIIADAAAPALAQNYARLLLVELQFDSLPPEKLREMLAPLAVDGAPWRYPARLLQGVLLGKAGDHQTAATLFATLVADPSVTSAIREQAKLLARYYATLIAPPAASTTK